MRVLLLFLIIALLSGCIHTVQREITLYPNIESHAIDGDFFPPDSHVFKTDGDYLQRAILKFKLDDSAVVYVNHRIEVMRVHDLRAMRIVDFGFYSKTQLLTIPLGKTTRFVFLDVEFERPSTGLRFRSKAELEMSTPHAEHFLGTATRDDRLDREVLGNGLSAFVATQFVASVTALMSQPNLPNKLLEPTSTVIVQPIGRTSSQL
jgi:hypothetical protein